MWHSSWMYTGYVFGVTLSASSSPRTSETPDWKDRCRTERLFLTVHRLPTCQQCNKILLVKKILYWRKIKFPQCRPNEMEDIFIMSFVSAKCCFWTERTNGLTVVSYFCLLHSLSPTPHPSLSLPHPNFISSSSNLYFLLLNLLSTLPSHLSLSFPSLLSSLIIHILSFLPLPLPSSALLPIFKLFSSFYLSIFLASSVNHI